MILWKKNRGIVRPGRSVPGTMKPKEVIKLIENTVGVTLDDHKKELWDEKRMSKNTVVLCGSLCN